ncbi:SAC3 family protein B-like isoform X2 [Amborella trichopoda]|uniref:SAC3 family protein B-like isoform X2 n=1 Tax=Amborella trichopoda TaxID=13333 RepID=UPI0009BF2888|nr:SAC3 family protein B-like isoform X2 [Amborella trichopoda]|eukprot:XP_020526816.1 SAC3 family protein B-like isoform X2 [Amborella trichopoda]
MHAHFAKGEDIESLLQYHGSLIKHFEDAYMVKEGPFLNADRDYVTKCSRLVHLKKSAKVVDDVVSNKVTHLQVEKRTGNVMEKPHKKIGHLIKSKWVDSADEGMHYSDAGIFYKDNQHDSMFKAPLLVNSSPLPINSEFIANTYMVESPQFASDQDGSQLVAMEITNECQLTEDDNLMDQSVGHMYLPEVDEAPEFGTSKVLEINNTNEEPVRSMALIEHVDNEVEMVNQKDEADNARLKLIIRLWKQCSKKRRGLRAASVDVKCCAEFPVIGTTNSTK